MTEDELIPLAVYAPATVAAQTAVRDELMRESCAVMDEWFGITRNADGTVTFGRNPDYSYEGSDL
jgi:hypothetical protein